MSYQAPSRGGQTSIKRIILTVEVSIFSVEDIGEALTRAVARVTSQGLGIEPGELASNWAAKVTGAQVELPR